MTEAPDWLLRMPERIAGLDDAWFRDFAPPAEVRQRSAVLMLFGAQSDGEPDVLLTERGAQLRSHASQVSFPGGRQDPGDADAVAAALREAQEEVGVDPAGVDVIFELPELYLTPSQNAVTPVGAWWRLSTDVTPLSPIEVERVVRAPIAELVDPANRFLVDTPGGYVSPGFDVRGLFVWGFTAKLLEVTLDLAGLTRPWDTDARRPLPPAVWESILRRGRG